MKLRLSIAKKLTLGFGILTIAFAINTILTYITLNKNKKVNDDITNIYAPSASYINQLYEMITNSKLLIKNWVFIEQNPQTPDKLKLVKLHEEEFPLLNKQLEKISAKWDSKEQKEYKLVVSTIRDTLFVYHKLVMEMLNSFESYDDPMVMFSVQPMVEQSGEIMIFTEKILSKLTNIKNLHDNKVKIERDKMSLSFNKFQKSIIYMGILILLIAITIGFITTRSLVRPINYMKNVLFKMGKGHLPTEKIKVSKDEIGEMATALNSLINSLHDISNFAGEIGKGNFNKEFSPLSNDDKLGYSLINMRNNLKLASDEQEKRKNEDLQRSWSSNGIAMFSDILRQNNDNLDELSYNIISNLVKYIDANQGGLFILNDNIIEMKACYAYDKRKYLQKSFEKGIGLVGRCFLENEIIYLTEIPDNYINITSGLGNEKPNCILIVPMILNNEIHGVIEIASFKLIEQYKIDFIKRLGESIAATFSYVKTTIQTSYLLEKTKKQAEEMSQQEEEMRQNMEELQATQEESIRREEELKKDIQALKELLSKK